jgi:hypothetical protein
MNHPAAHLHPLISPVSIAPDKWLCNSGAFCGS